VNGASVRPEEALDAWRRMSNDPRAFHIDAQLVEYEARFESPISSQDWLPGETFHASGHRTGSTFIMEWRTPASAWRVLIYRIPYRPEESPLNLWGRYSGFGASLATALRVGERSQARQ